MSRGFEERADAGLGATLDEVGQEDEEAVYSGLKITTRTRLVGGSYLALAELQSTSLVPVRDSHGIKALKRGQGVPVLWSKEHVSFDPKTAFQAAVADVISQYVKVASFPESDSMEEYLTKDNVLEVPDSLFEL